MTALAEPSKPAGPSTIAVIATVLNQHLRGAQLGRAILAALVSPAMYLAAIGFGLGSQVDDEQLARLGAESYQAWLGPAMLAASAMMIGAREAMWPTMAQIRWMGAYRAFLYTPVGPGRLGIGHMAWITTRAIIASACFALVLAVAGLVTSFWGLAMVAVAGLVAIAHAGPIVAFTASTDQDNAFPMLLRVVVFPLFVFSGAFFPIEDLPGAVALIARILPLWHGIESCRLLAAGIVDSTLAGHLAVLGAWAAFGMVISTVVFARKVAP